MNTSEKNLDRDLSICSDDMSSQRLCVVLVLSIIVFAESIGEGCNPSDLRGLNSFKAAIQMDTSGRLEKWVGHSCCRWEGIICHNTTGRVTKILLPGFISSDQFLFQSQMKGRLSPSITLLSYLEVIDLGGLTGLAGNIPPSIGFHLPNLRKLYLYGNNLTGAVPESIGKLSKLEELALHENRLSESLPPTLGELRNLKMLHLYSNQFSGVIPDSLTNLTNLMRLDLHSNSLSGQIPDSIGQLQVLEELDLSNNFLSGKLPQSLTNLTAISVLYLDTNYLEGSIPFPSSSGQMPLLGFLRLHDNRLTGRVRPNFGYLVSLQRVSLANNNLCGPVPSTVGNLVALTELYIGGNRLSGQLPKSMGQLSRLLVLSLPHNLIRGPLPHEMSSLQNLQILYLSFNRLNLSTIPEWLAALPSLSRIFLAGCGIQGRIPEFLRTTSSPIQELDLSANHLSGSIPEWLGSLSQLYLLNLSKNSLVSNIPESVTSLHDLGVLDLHSNKLTGTINQVFQIGQRFPDGSLTYIDLSDNSFNGGIEETGIAAQRGIQFLNLSKNSLEGRLPTAVGALISMRSLDLSYNYFNFSLPEALGDVSLLETLKLQENHFTGAIPKGFLKLRKLKELDLSHNLLVGEIPAGKPLSDFPENSYSGNKGLCGNPLAPCL